MVVSPHTEGYMVISIYIIIEGKVMAVRKLNSKPE